MNDVELLSIHRTALALRELAGGAAGHAGGQIVLVTSARAGEGKSFMAGLLAQALAAQDEGEVLLVEAGSGGEPDALGGGAGLRGLLAGAPLADLTRPMGEHRGLWRLPRGEGYSTGQLFRVAKLREALQPLRTRFAVTVIDGPELAASGALLGLTDRSVLVVDASRTPGAVVRSAVEAALGAARVPREHLAGVLLNRQPAGLPRWLGG